MGDIRCIDSVVCKNEINLEVNESYAVCVGVGKQSKNPKIGGKSTFSSPHYDAKLVFDVLQQQYHFKRTNVTILSKFAGSNLMPTKKNILDTLKQVANKTPQNGTFIFYYSGHCDKMDSDQPVLIPELIFEQDNLVEGITLKEIVEAVTNSPSCCLLFIFDCCWAGALANYLASPDTDIPVNCKITALAACNSNEKALGHLQFKYGFFTYLLVGYIKWYTQQNSETKIFPAYKLIQDCKPILKAFLSLLRPTEIQHMELQHYTKDESLGLGLDNDGLTPPVVEYYQELRQFLDEPYNRSELILPNDILNWFTNVVEPTVRIFNSINLLNRDLNEFYTFILLLITENINTMLSELQLTNNPSIQPALFINAFIRISIIMENINGDLQPQICHMEYCLRLFFAKLWQDSIRNTIANNYKNKKDLTSPEESVSNLIILNTKINDYTKRENLTLINDHTSCLQTVKEQLNSKDIMINMILNDMRNSKGKKTIL